MLTMFFFSRLIVRSFVQVRAVVCLLTVSLLSGQVGKADEIRSYQRPQSVQGVNQPVLSLNGMWQFQFSPEGKTYDVAVPGELAMQGFAIEHDKAYTYFKTFNLPASYKGKQIILRFDGVYSHARLFVNGAFVREHNGGFTRWETDITSFAKPGQENEIRMEVTDRLDEISYASGYAHHPVGGILRDVSVFVLPQASLCDFGVVTQLDTLYQDAKLKLSYSISNSKNVKIVYTLTGANGTKITKEFPVRQDGLRTDSFDVKQPLKWDSEHPNLYTLNVSVRQGGREVYNFSNRVGFREVKIVGNRMQVNGQPVKLRGACRHDIHPELGRTSTAEMDSLDVVLFKESNMNFVRTSHYPPTEKFLENCDRFGIYVECESAVCFVDTYRQKNYAPGQSQNDPAFAAQYVSQCQEMVKSFRSHPSILFWSIGNESVYGSNFQQSWDWVKANDLTRPVIFSYPGSEREKNKVYDILSMHYPYVDGNLSQWGMTTQRFQGHGIPALFDEWAHPACYTYNTLQIDPNIREFWGMSIDMMWNNLFESPGGLGGAIWGYVDEIFMLPVPKEGKPYWKEFAHTAKPEGFQGNCVGYGEWGIVDIWRRKKPEFWSTKKAYSPVRLLVEKIEEFSPVQRLVLPVYNRFDHTNLHEIKGYYTYKGVRKELQLPAIAPHQKGMLVLPAADWVDGETLKVEFIAQDNGLIDAYLLPIGEQKIDLPKTAFNGKLSVEDSADKLIVRGNGFVIPFCKESGLICNAESNGKVVIEKGPFLNMDVNLNHLTGAEVRSKARNFLSADVDWKKTGFTYTEKDGQVQVKLSGTYDFVSVDIDIMISAEGKLEFNYTTRGEPNGYVRESGLRFHLSDALDHLAWKRKGYWNFYPENQFAGNEGSVSFYDSKQAAYGQQPVQGWQSDNRNYFYWADEGAGSKKPLTVAAQGMKENIYSYTLSANGKGGLSVVSATASTACRTIRLSDEQLMLYTNNRWDYPEIAWGNYCKTIENTPCYGKITLVLF